MIGQSVAHYKITEKIGFTDARSPWAKFELALSTNSVTKFSVSGDYRVQVPEARFLSGALGLAFSSSNPVDQERRPHL